MEYEERQQIVVGKEKEYQKYIQQINDMLLAAGYFRARMAGITQFDKVFSLKSN
jgi:hypothetical protein